MTLEQMLTFPSGNEQLEAFLARPEAETPVPGIVVIHEIFGLNDNIKDIARRLASEGYAALAVDMFSGRNRVVCMFRFFAGIMLNSLDHGGIHDLKAALDFLSAQPGVDKERVGAIGFCMGGSFALAWASADDRLRVTAPFYGMNPRPLGAVARSCPVVGSYPGKDYTAPHARKLARELRQDHVPHDIKIYPGARHAFFNDTGPLYDPKAAEDAWRRTIDYFKEMLA